MLHLTAERIGSAVLACLIVLGVLRLNGCGYTHLREDVPQRQPPDAAVVGPAAYPIEYFEDTLQISEPYFVIDTLSSPQVMRGPDEEWRLRAAVEEEACAKGANGVLGFRTAPWVDRWADAPDDELLVGTGALVLYDRSILRPNNRFLRFRIPGDFHLVVDIRGIAGDSVSHADRWARTSYTVDTGELRDGIYRITFSASEYKVNGWTESWKSTRWFLVERPDSNSF